MPLEWVNIPVDFALITISTTFSKHQLGLGKHKTICGNA